MNRFPAIFLIWLLPLVVATLLQVLFFYNINFILLAVSLGFDTIAIIGFISDFRKRSQLIRNSVANTNYLIISVDPKLMHKFEELKDIFSSAEYRFANYAVIEKLAKIDKRVYFAAEEVIVVIIKQPGDITTKFGKVRGLSHGNLCSIEYGSSERMKSLLYHEIAHSILSQIKCKDSDHHKIIALAGL